MAKRRAVYPITRSDQLQVLRSPVRQTILDALASSDEPCSVAQIANLTGRPADALYYHLRALQRVGLVTQAGSVSTGGRESMLYTTPGLNMRVSHEPNSRTSANDMVRIVSAMTRLTDRDFKKGVHSPDARHRGRRRNVRAFRKEAWLTNAQLEEINELLDRILELTTDESGEVSGKRHAITLTLVPLDAKRK